MELQAILYTAINRLTAVDAMHQRMCSVKRGRRKSASKIQQPLYLSRGCSLLVRKHSTIVLFIVQSCKFI